MILSILLVEKIRLEASVFFQMMWMGVLHLKFQMKFVEILLRRFFKEDAKL
jgi:hypothetical protein